MNPRIRRQVLDCASPLALLMAPKRRRAAAVQDALAPARVLFGSWPVCSSFWNRRPLTSWLAPSPRRLRGFGGAGARIRLRKTASPGQALAPPEGQMEPLQPASVSTRIFAKTRICFGCRMPAFRITVFSTCSARPPRTARTKCKTASPPAIRTSLFFRNDDESAPSKKSVVRFRNAFWCNGTSRAAK